jgi:hypothetical protein
MGKYDINLLVNEIAKADKGSTEYKSDFWKPTIEKGQESAEYTIRFVENPDATGISPWVERPAHMFSFPNKKYLYEPCAKKHSGQPCFICEEVSKLYASGSIEQENIGAKRFAKKRFFHNILVVEDSRDGGKNEGKILVYEFGSKIHDKCLEMINSKELDPKERIYFHPIYGTNFKLRISEVGGHTNYDSSSFSRKNGPIVIKGKTLDLDEAETFITENAIKLNERLFKDKTFKSYEDLKDLYLNQGVPKEGSSKTFNKAKPAAKAEVEIEEEVEEVVKPTPTKKVDTTIKNQPVAARNPEKKVEVHSEIDEDDAPFKVDMSAEDAELEALLGN